MSNDLAIERIDAAIERRKNKLATGYLPAAWNHEPHSYSDYLDNRLRSEMNGLELALWFLNGKKGRRKKWG